MNLEATESHKEILLGEPGRSYIWEDLFISPLAIKSDW
jgi:hypothetical protein